ncbi:bifunctional serine/threonine-protein kinase/ABC transporter substrate-binding protein [Sorangium atrum]|uniref:Bifunctional serine/threonine-protein kinase/ABC transporter substrate-binding protein n=1 Tax=Sorangium atrum TaxID=2995308 RepID=A0ABT5BQ59_9BACT|nr:bifunctional serine/threonine-protein kinase/ABC transporter substrate-binding protein [Sorangium aterium]MDC0676288.1 bifunctional serine/threonine-protein kinase/ABC transporter substrate-binding protein [Sorangium aterium]
MLTYPVRSEHRASLGTAGNMVGTGQDTSDAEPTQAAILGKYRLIAKLGRGGMGDVFLAIARGPGSFNKLVVVKRHRGVGGDGEKVVAMFLDEAKLSARLNHPNIVQTYEVDHDDDGYFTVMEYLEGQPLSALMRAVAEGEPGAAGFTRGVWVRIVADLLSGLHYAHELRDYDGAPLGIVHRDVSPHNIFVTYDGAVKLLDFGIAKASINADLTETGKLKGKTSYMAPEQAVGSGSTDRRADIFVAGIVLWELLTRERLFGGDAVSALWKLAAVDEIPRPSLLRPDIPPALDAIVARALDRDPAKRFATAQEMRAALEDYLRAAGEDVGSDEIGASMLAVFAERRASMQRQVKAYLDQSAQGVDRPSTPAEPRPSRVSHFEGAEGRRIQPVIALDEDLGQRTSGTPGPGRPASDSTSLRSNPRTAAGPQQRSYWIGALGAAALVAAAAFSTRRPGGQAPAAGSAAAVLVEPDAGARCTGVLRVRITTGDTGTATDISPPYNYGVYDYLRHLNDSQGGLRGCPIDVDMKDAQYDPAKTEEVIEAWRQQPGWSEVSTLFVFGTGPTTRVAPRLMEEKKLIIPGSYAGSLATPVPISADVSHAEFNALGQSAAATEHKTSPGYPYIFFPATDYSTAIRIGIKAAWKIAPGRIAMVHDTIDKCLYCVDPLAAGKAYVEELPGMMLGEDLIVPQTSSLEDEGRIVDAVLGYVKREIEKKRADPSYVPTSWFWAGNSVLPSSFVGKGAAAAQKLIQQAFPGPEKNRWQLRVMANNWGIGERTLAICGADCAGIFYGLFPVPVYGDTQHSSGMAEMLRIHRAYREKDGHPLELYQDQPYVQGHAAALMWREAVERAIDAGRTHPTGEDLKAALEGFQNVVLDGMTAGPISFSAKDHRPQANESVYTIGGGADGGGVGFRFVDHCSIELDAKWLGY